jgi:hypothetical protein
VAVLVLTATADQAAADMQELTVAAAVLAAKDSQVVVDTLAMQVVVVAVLAVVV